MGKYFDQQFIRLLETGDLEGAIALLIRKYPHLKKDKNRQDLYITRYKRAYLDNPMALTRQSLPPENYHVVMGNG